MPNRNPTKLQRLQSDVLEAIATGMSLADTAELLCRRAEQLAPGVTCSILSVDRCDRLRPVAAPSLPEHYSTALDGLLIGPGVGSCGSAAYFGQSVEVTDIANDPRWAPFAGLAVTLGLAACWSTPVKDGDGKVIGTFAFYYKEPRGPGAIERAIVKTCTNLCAIAMVAEQTRRRNDELAQFDQLTQLPNRRRFDETMAERLAEPDPRFGLLLVDIDYLKAVNDTMGHAVGDRLIQEVAARLRHSGFAAMAFRIGGDEFALITDCNCDHDELRALAGRLVDLIAFPFQHGDMVAVPQVTIGGAVCGIDGIDADSLQQNADFALYHGKEINRGSYVPFDQSLRTTITQRISSIREVSQALSDNRIIAHYQPLVRLDTAEIIGLEALARMRRPDGTIVSAGAFQAAISDPNIAYRLTCSMLRQVAADLKMWLGMGIPFQHVGINLSFADFAQRDLEQRLEETFGAAGVPLHHIVLEVTETVMMDGVDAGIADVLRRLRAKGVKVALDDFGTGYASLTHLLSYPVDIIKIDKSFVDRLLTDRYSNAIVEALIDIARKLDMRIVAEGIETLEQADRLRELDCVLGQGYHFARSADMPMTTVMLQSFSQRMPDEGIITKQLASRSR
ncbi:bifunctional diguanylate cyclase/phosphodiesterase [Mangrovicella endophytica]|uniref:bifunctional diguanylate cyclase/phosphodiesterase n=1 Tax=Mangrovicella endophytica TaxID=2066697 RepID=UPI000C9E7B10|nr:EAL domain-containing protein [Mangrovicella endophytica]